ncbi:MAG TPA: biopolymer transporter ExbD [Thermoanaerobaculia bacterium]
MNVTPLVDICLVLLIIFMFVLPTVVNGVPVKLPAAAHSEAGTPPRQLAVHGQERRHGLPRRRGPAARAGRRGATSCRCSTGAAARASPTSGWRRRRARRHVRTEPAENREEDRPNLAFVPRPRPGTGCHGAARPTPGAAVVR